MRTFMLVVVVALLTYVPCFGQEVPPSTTSSSNEKPFTETGYLMMPETLVMVPDWYNRIEPGDLENIETRILDVPQPRAYMVGLSAFSVGKIFRRYLEATQRNPDDYALLQAKHLLWRDISHIAWYICFIEKKYVKTTKATGPTEVINSESRRGF